MYYHHPADHTLVRVGDPSGHCPDGGLVLHFLGKRRAIEPVYKTNIQEVLEFETGHMLGVLEEVLPEHGLTVRPLGHFPAVKDTLDVADEDYYLGTFAITPDDDEVPRRDSTELFVQAHPGRVEGLPGGQYRYRDGRLEPLGEELIEPRHVIAINQGVYDRASFGISAVSRAAEPWLEYIELGTRLHHLQRTPGFGFMSSGYSSKTGHPLTGRPPPGRPPRRRLPPERGVVLLPRRPGQRRAGRQRGHARGRRAHQGSRRDDPRRTRPLPAGLHAPEPRPRPGRAAPDGQRQDRHEGPRGLPEVTAARTAGPYVAPETPTEVRLAVTWGTALKYPDPADVSTEDNFFASGGNSLIAVALVNRINREYGTKLPLQALFEAPTLRELAARIDEAPTAPVSRLIPWTARAVSPPSSAGPGSAAIR